MPRYERVEFVPGDEVRKGDREGVIRLSYPRKSDGKRFPIVYAFNGPAAREWPNGWTPQLDEDGGTVQEHCRLCERTFKRRPESRQIFCRTHAREEERETKLMEAFPSKSSRYQDVRWKHEHRGRKLR